MTTVEEPQYAGSNGALKIALDMPREYWKDFSTTQATPQTVKAGASGGSAKSDAKENKK